MKINPGFKPLPQKPDGNTKPTKPTKPTHGGLGVKPGSNPVSDKPGATGSIGKPSKPMSGKPGHPDCIKKPVKPMTKPGLPKDEIKETLKNPPQKSPLKPIQDGMVFPDKIINKKK